MGLLQTLGLTRRAAATPTGTVEFLPILNQQLSGLTAEDLWRDQPHLRTVTTFIARMVATVSLHCYERETDGGRTRLRDGDLADLIGKPNDHETMYDFLYGSVLDLCLYDEVFWFLTSNPDTIPRFSLLRIPPAWIQETKWLDPWHPAAYAIGTPREGRVWLPADQTIRLHGYSPVTPRRGTSPIDALKDSLHEQLEAAAYRSQLWKNGPRLGGIITRPAGVQWDNTARRRFKAAWQAQYSGRGSGTGGVPILEDGMTFQQFHLSAKDEQLVEMTKLSLETVAQVYHVNPTMVGVLDNANYANVREFRQSLYGDSLGPLMKQLEQALNGWLVPMLADRGAGCDPRTTYVEFNVEDRLRGRFEEQAQVTSTAVGAPWMTRNEARAMNNLPAVDGGDVLVLPLNTAADPADPNGPDPAAPATNPPEEEEGNE
ncbi:phage portal protein [Corynebacterium pyruviciproducens]|uniref:phage portal protein n=1 Tax=Corynebacterium pyruviciproducens TaxID=598660 RepID=UPI0028894D3C|nr:phage portal protein [Corynebacterium pyruviciproducens]